ncbi:MAG: iron chelate uptake ABC transporter family permease subunit, partial [Nitrospirota bacterium]
MPILTLKRWVSFISLLTLVLTGAILFGLLTGTERISLMETIQIIQHGIGTDDHSLGPKAIILFQVRLPRVLMAGLVGAILALCGVVFQVLLRNPLADPFILGISSGSALGVYLAMLLDLRIGLLGFA